LLVREVLGGDVCRVGVVGGRWWVKAHVAPVGAVVSFVFACCRWGPEVGVSWSDGCWCGFGQVEWGLGKRLQWLGRWTTGREWGHCQPIGHWCLLIRAATLAR
jgi:hypothetical protein